MWDEAADGTNKVCNKHGKADGTFEIATKLTKYEVESDESYPKYGLCADYVAKEATIGDAIQLMVCSLFGMNCPSESY